MLNRRNLPSRTARLVSEDAASRFGLPLKTDDTSFENHKGHVLPHLDAAYNLAYWLMLNDHAAPDAAFEAYTEAYRVFEARLQAREAGIWILRRIHDICYARLREDRRFGRTAESFHFDARALNWEEALQRANDRRRLLRAMRALPVTFREALVLRELETFSYKEIAEVTGVSVASVMLRLGEARRGLVHFLCTLE